MERRIARVLMPFVAACTAIVIPQPAQAQPTSVTLAPRIVGGTIDAYAHPYGAAVFRAGATTPNCSGVLVATSSNWPVVLTDAHCVTPVGKSTGGVRVAFADVWDPAKDNIYPGTVRIDPAYNRARSKLHDIAVIVPAWQPPARPAHLAAPGTIDRVRPKYAVTVGYGDPNRGHRRYATERVVSWNANWLRLVQGNGNSCGGDSGGADLLPGTDTVIALTDLGSCTKDQDTRVDNAAVARFVNSATRLVLRSRAGSR